MNLNTIIDVLLFAVNSWFKLGNQLSAVVALNIVVHHFGTPYRMTSETLAVMIQDEAVRCIGGDKSDDGSVKGRCS